MMILMTILLLLLLLIIIIIIIIMIVTMILTQIILASCSTFQSGKSDPESGSFELQRALLD